MKKSLNDKSIIGALFMDLSKSFDCILMIWFLQNIMIKVLPWWCNNIYLFIFGNKKAGREKKWYWESV